jgi:hypothetical protein
MTLEEFIAETKARLEKFEQKWHLENSKNPAEWPNEMGRGDWDEQFMIFDEGE